MLAGNLAARSPLIALLDDVHLADASSWQALDYLAWNLSGTLVLATARPELAQYEVAAQVLFRLEEDGILRRLPLDTLDRSGVSDLAAGILEREPESALVDWLAQRSQGNPLFATGLLRALLEEGADLSAPRLQRLPESLTERVSSRIRGLDEDARLVLELLAVLGRKVDLADLVSLSNRSLENIAPVLERLVAGRFLTEEEVGRDIAYEITHPLIAETIYSGVGAARRRALHRSAGRTLRNTGRLSEASLHYARSADVGDSEAIEALLEAMRQAEDREAFREALAIISALVDLIPTGDERWLEVAEAMSWQADWVVEHKAGLDAAKGIRALQEIDGLLARSREAAHPARRAAVKSRLAAFCAWGTGQLDEAERYATEAVALFEAAGDRSGALVADLELAYVRGLGGDYSTLESEAGRVLEEAQRGGFDFVVLQGLGALGFGAFFHGNFAPGAAAMTRAAELARAQGKEYFVAWSMSELGFNLGFQGRMDEALPLLKEAKSASRHWRDTPIPDWEIALHLLAGDLALALERAEEAVAWNAGGMSRRRGIGMAFGALAAAEAARLDDAARYVALGTAAYEDIDWSFYGDYCRYAEAVVAWREGRPSEAVTVMRRLASRLLSLEARPFAALLLVDVAEVAAACGDVGTAEDAVTGLEKVADAMAVPFYRGLAALGAAWWGLVGGPSGAVSAQQAVNVLSELGCRLYLGRALDVLGRLLASADPGAARRSLDSAAAIFEECGAPWRQERAAEALEGLEGR